MTKDIENRIALMFPQLSNKAEDVENSNTLTSTELWGTLSEKYADKVKKILAPTEALIMDVSTDLQVRDADALPVVQVEVVNSVGSAIKNCTNWD